MGGDYCREQLSDPTLLKKTEEYAMTLGSATMRYTLDVYGDEPEGGYPLYICLHGGGSDDTPDFNDKQWAAMRNYYTDHLKCGVYVAVRGVRDTWDCHFNPESYPLYDRLIQYMINTRQVDPNRVYLLGFSAGGDGVYAISARMPDRFAAVNMSSGHPNDISLINLRNLPILLQAGEFDTDFDRHRITAEYGLKLNDLQQLYGGYTHRTLIHYDRGHNYEDYSRTPVPVIRDIEAWFHEDDRTTEEVNSYAVDFVDQFTRDPMPESLIWDLSTRADSRETEAFYYMTAPYTTNRGLVIVRCEGDNRFTIDTQDVNGEFSMLLNEYMVDFSVPVTFTVDGRETTLTLTPDYNLLRNH